MKFQAINFIKFKQTTYYQSLPEDVKEEMEITTQLFPFKTNEYIISSLVNWSDIRKDPIFKINFPCKEMVPKDRYYFLFRLLKKKIDENVFDQYIKEIRSELYPKNVFTPSKYIPILDGKPLHGFLHEIESTLLAMVKPARPCFAHCSYCFVWPIHVLPKCDYGYDKPEASVNYLKEHNEITDVFYSGGDMLTMSTTTIKKYIIPLLSIRSLKTIRIGTRALSWWPYRLTHENDSKDLIDFFKKVGDSGKHLTIISHICHPRELNTQQAQNAIRKINSTGALIRCQSPIIKSINDDVDTWVEMLEKMINLAVIPYYMFIDLNVDPINCFKIPLVDAYTVYSNTMRRVSGLAKTMCGPVVDYGYRKILVEGISEINKEKKIILKCLQSPDQLEKGKVTTIPFDPDIVDLTTSTITFN